MLVVVLNIVNTIGEFILGKLVVAHAAAAIASGARRRPERGRDHRRVLRHLFFWSIWSASSSSCFWSRGSSITSAWRGAPVHPAVHRHVQLRHARRVAQCSPSCGWRRFSRTAPTIRSNNTARHALFLPTSREAKYNAQQAIDPFSLARRRSAAGGGRSSRARSSHSASAATRLSTSRWSWSGSPSSSASRASTRS